METDPTKTNPPNPSANAKPVFPDRPDRLPAQAPLLPTPGELLALLDRKVIGQSEAKRTLAVATYNHFLLCALAEQTGWPVEPTSVMLIGRTGSGKSHLLKTLRDCLGVPMIYVTCTGLTQNGYKGTNINEVIERLENELLEDTRTHPAIVVWDEVDKLREVPGAHPVAARGVQEDLLTYLDGTFCGRSGQLDSTRFLNVACGAFVALDEFRKPRDTKPRIGFFPTSDADPAQSPGPLSTQHLIDYGLIPEFVGRFGAITELDPLDAATLKRIMTHAEDSAMVKKKRLFQLHGIDLRITDGALDEMVAQAIRMGTGARSLKRILQTTLGGYDHRLPDLAAKQVTALTITAETVRGDKPALQTISQEPQSLDQLLALRQHAGAYASWKKKPKEEFIW